jgi:hypothetical protein
MSSTHTCVRAIVLAFLGLSASGCFDKSSLAPAPDATDVPPELPCPEPYYPGDGLRGKQCWDPQAGNYCKSGLGGGTAWYCRSNPLKCCFHTSQGCFRCGWVQVDRQVNPPMCWDDASESEPTDPPCPTIVEGLIPPYSDCVGLASVSPVCLELIEQLDADEDCTLSVDSHAPVCLD